MKNPRINVTFDENIVNLLTLLAIQENKSVASLVRELSLEALELREDFYLSKIAEKRDTKNAIMCTDENAWQ